MSFIVSTYNTFFYEPLLNGLIFLINVIPMHDIGIAVVVLTVIVRLIIFPFNHKSIITQRKIRELGPEIDKIKKKTKDNKQEQAKKVMDLYKSHGVNPLSGLLTLFIQIPIIIALYRVFMAGVDFNLDHLYSFTVLPEFVKMNFLGFIDMSQNSYLLAVTAGVSQFFQMKLAIPPIKKASKDKSFKAELARSMSIQAKYVMPALVFFISLKFSAAVALYWTTMNVFAIVHEASVRKMAKKIYEKPTDRDNQESDRDGN